MRYLNGTTNMYAVVVGVEVLAVKFYFKGSLNIIDFTNISRTKP